MLSGAGGSRVARVTRFALFALFASCGDGPPAASSRTSSAVTAEGAMTHVALDLGDRHGCVLRSDGRVFCWGNNQRRQANPASAATTVPSVASAAAVLAPDGADLFAAELSVSNQTSCARRADGAVFCWGSDDHGVISGTASPGVNRPATLVPLTTGTETRTARGIGLGWRHLCAVRDDGQIACRGDNNRRQLGDTTPPPAGQMVLVRVSAFSPLFNAAKVVSGDEHSCALLADGQVFCWGDWQATNGVGTLATLVTSNVVDITAGDNHTCALHADHVITCWGANESGQLGNNSTTASATPVLRRPSRPTGHPA